MSALALLAVVAPVLWLGIGVLVGRWGVRNDHWEEDDAVLAAMIWPVVLLYQLLSVLIRR